MLLKVLLSCDEALHIDLKVYNQLYGNLDNKMQRTMDGRITRINLDVNCKICFVRSDEVHVCYKCDMRSNPNFYPPPSVAPSPYSFHFK